MCHVLLLLPLFALPLLWFLPCAEGLILYAGVCVLSAALYWLIFCTMHRRPMTGIEGMIGEIGTVFGVGEGKAKIFYRGEIWDTVTKEQMFLGERVEIIGFDRMKLVVRRQV